MQEFATGTARSKLSENFRRNETTNLNMTLEKNHSSTKLRKSCKSRILKNILVNISVELMKDILHLDSSLSLMYSRT